MTPRQTDSELSPLEEQRQVTLVAILHAQQALTRSPLPEVRVFQRMVSLLETALKSTVLSELQAIQQEAEASRPAPPHS
ncbi:hypothetical protein [Deinococcus sp. QL22]|uniref:hypothetical protein n=1 Tax=Deinococcus sp. QL22 TaxID=2939437 RepID=UPI0020178A78|nr:hypothetical protein [Deinococcus sp. QL22]UQN04897.1 hypothetical protein M1R55_08165 [Deinococcus sp. QL22]